MLRGLDLHDLLARFEGNFDRPSPREGRDDPAQACVQVGGEQILVLELAPRVADQDHQDRPQSQHLGPDCLKRNDLQLARNAVGRGFDRLPSPRPASAAVAVGLFHGLIRTGKARPFGCLPSGPAFGLLPRHRIVNGRIGAHHPHAGHSRVEIGEQVLRRIGPIAEENQLPAGKPFQDVAEHFLGQRGFALLVLARQMQPGVDRKAVDLGGSRDADRQSDHHPVVAAGSGHPFGRRGHRIAEPSQAEDVFAALVQQRVVDDEIQQPAWVEPDDHGHGDLMGQVARDPSRAAEEVVEAVEGVPLPARNRRVGLDCPEHPVLRPFAQAHHPTEQDLHVGLKRRLGEHGQQALQNRVERRYAPEHERGPPCPLRASWTLSTTQSLQGTPFSF